MIVLVKIKTYMNLKNRLGISATRVRCALDLQMEQFCLHGVVEILVLDLSGTLLGYAGTDFWTVSSIKWPVLYLLFCIQSDRGHKICALMCKSGCPWTVT